MSFDLTDLHTLIVRAHDRHKVPIGKAMRAIMQAAANLKFPLYKSNGSPLKLRRVDRKWLLDHAAIAEQQNAFRWWEKKPWLALRDVRANEPKFWGWFNCELDAPKTTVSAEVRPKRARNKRDRARRAIDALWPHGAPDQSTLENGSLCSQVSDWLKRESERQGIQHVAISDDTILRAAGRK
ncbi:MAG: hypothetical protein WCB70_23000 [Xanthobacteraceae bacterium]